jgi:hypothetical protein
MAEDKKAVITIDDIEYTEDQLTETAKGCINHIQSLDQKIASASFNLTQLQGGREFFMARLKAEIEQETE